MRVHGMNDHDRASQLANPVQGPRLIGRPGRSRTRLAKVVDEGPLSAREFEVAALGGAGKTNKEIATELYLSERTAQNHVQPILTKLGVTNRTQIGAWFHDRRRRENGASGQRSSSSSFGSPGHGWRPRWCGLASPRKRPQRRGAWPRPPHGSRKRLHLPPRAFAKRNLGTVCRKSAPVKRPGDGVLRFSRLVKELGTAAVGRRC